MLFTNATLATMDIGKPYGLIERGAVVVQNGAIAWTGAADDLPSIFYDHESPRP